MIQFLQEDLHFLLIEIFPFLMKETKMKKSQSQNYPISKKIILTVIKPKMTKEEIYLNLIKNLRLQGLKITKGSKIQR